MSNYTVIELFAGAGGLALGFENAGIHTNLLVEIDKIAVATLRLNRPKWNILHNDITNVDFQGMNADILTGGFPCQSFSYAGKKLGFDDVRGTLFFEYARAVKQVQPKIILAENVKGLEKHNNGQTLNVIISTLDELGYRCEYKILRSHYFDVAQKRERLIIIGVRKDLSIPIIFPKENANPLLLRDALKNSPLSDGYKYSEKKRSIREYARIQSFPDDWTFCGSISAQYKQIGNAVPVNLAHHIGNSLVKMLNSI